MSKPTSQFTAVLKAQPLPTSAKVYLYLLHIATRKPDGRWFAMVKSRTIAEALDVDSNKEIVEALALISASPGESTFKNRTVPGYILPEVSIKQRDGSGDAEPMEHLECTVREGPTGGAEEKEREEEKGEKEAGEQEGLQEQQRQQEPEPGFELASRTAGGNRHGTTPEWRLAAVMESLHLLHTFLDPQRGEAQFMADPALDDIPQHIIGEYWRKHSPDLWALTDYREHPLLVPTYVRDVPRRRYRELADAALGLEPEHLELPA